MHDFVPHHQVSLEDFHFLPKRAFSGTVQPQKGVYLSTAALNVPIKSLFVMQKNSSQICPVHNPVFPQYKFTEEDLRQSSTSPFNYSLTYEDIK